MQGSKILELHKRTKTDCQRRIRCFKNWRVLSHIRIPVRNKVLFLAFTTWCFGKKIIIGTKKGTLQFRLASLTVKYLTTLNSNKRISPTSPQAIALRRRFKFDIFYFFENIQILLYYYIYVVALKYTTICLFLSGCPDNRFKHTSKVFLFPI